MCVACTEGETGQHFRDFVDGDVDQDLAGFEDELRDERREAPPGVPEPAEEEAEEVRAEAESDAIAEQILLEATEHGVDQQRDARRPEEEAAALALSSDGVLFILNACACRPMQHARMRCNAHCSTSTG